MRHICVVQGPAMYKTNKQREFETLFIFLTGRSLNRDVETDNEQTQLQQVRLWAEILFWQESSYLQCDSVIFK